MLALDTQREPQAVQDGPATVPVYLTNATRTSAGPGPGVKHLPPAEANALIYAKLAAAGPRRPDEHTSEPQSHLKLVCRLLLEKERRYTRTPAPQRFFF